ncbi:hypothetical protein IMCC1989_1179 [gamma proteobacterium IMCC1989]|nr:hypothetical protein IMCC1989_1179 [gamma proteobacterium IMCC1989]
MKNNEIIRRLRFVLKVNDSVLAECFRLAGCKLPIAKINNFLLSEKAKEYCDCPNKNFIQFLDGLIVHLRGPSPNGLPDPVEIDNNVILKKVRIALTLESRDLDNIFMLADCEMSAHEISALFRKPNNKHFVECSDELLENFFGGLSLYIRD